MEVLNKDELYKMMRGCLIEGKFAIYNYFLELLSKQDIGMYGTDRLSKFLKEHIESIYKCYFASIYKYMVPSEERATRVTLKINDEMYITFSYKRDELTHISWLCFDGSTPRLAKSNKCDLRCEILFGTWGYKRVIAKRKADAEWKKK